MSVENPRDSYPPLQETLKPIDRVLVASANVIDQNAVFRPDRKKPVLDADWDDDKLGLRFILQEQRETGLQGQTNYFLRVFNQFSHDSAREFYAYDTLRQRISTCDENWKRLKIKRTSQQTADLVLSYLQSATQFPESNNQEFVAIMARSKIEDPRFGPTLRRFGSNVLRSLGL